MASKTGIPEFFAGTIALGLSYWIWPSAVWLQTTLFENKEIFADYTRTELMAMQLQADLAILTLGFYILFGIYWYSICGEHLIFWASEKYFRNKSPEK